MRKFSDITNAAITPDSEFAYLDSCLRSRGVQAFTDCELPAGCTPACMTLIFTYAYGEYAICFYDTVQYSGSDVGFASLCREQAMAFPSMDEMKAFLRNMDIGPSEANRDDRMEGRRMQARPMPTTDRQRLNLNNNGANRIRKVDAEQLFRDMTRIVRGQDQAARIVSNYACACTARLHPSRPVNLFLSGATGSGKSLMGTSLAYALNQQLDSRQRHYDTIIIHCNEMQEDHEVAKLIGAPAGYTGYGDATQLSPIAANPFHVVVFDEIEKASPRVLDVLMRAMDKGEIMLTRPIDGRATLDMKHCILIFTSNLPLEAAGQRGAMGFQTAAAHSQPGLASSRKALVKRYRDVLVAQGMRREIVARFTDIIRFEQLKDEAVVDIILQSVQQYASEYDLEIAYVAPEITQAIYDLAEMQYGARMVNYLVEESFGLCFAAVAGENACYDLCGTLEAPELRPHAAAAPEGAAPEGEPVCPRTPGGGAPTEGEPTESAPDLFSWEQDG